jgi:hypothetical protein
MNPRLLNELSLPRLLQTAAPDPHFRANRRAQQAGIRPPG